MNEDPFVYTPQDIINALNTVGYDGMGMSKNEYNRLVRQLENAERKGTYQGNYNPGTDTYTHSTSGPEATGKLMSNFGRSASAKRMGKSLETALFNPALRAVLYAPAIEEYNKRLALQKERIAADEAAALAAQQQQGQLGLANFNQGTQTGQQNQQQQQQGNSQQQGSVGFTVQGGGTQQQGNQGTGTQAGGTNNQQPAIDPVTGQIGTTNNYIRSQPDPDVIKLQQDITKFFINDDLTPNMEAFAYNKDLFNRFKQDVDSLVDGRYGPKTDFWKKEVAKAQQRDDFEYFVHPNNNKQYVKIGDDIIDTSTLDVVTDPSILAGLGQQVSDPQNILGRLTSGEITPQEMLDKYIMGGGDSVMFIDPATGIRYTASDNGSVFKDIAGEMPQSQEAQEELTNLYNLYQEKEMERMMHFMQNPSNDGSMSASDRYYEDPVTGDTYIATENGLQNAQTGEYAIDFTDARLNRLVPLDSSTGQAPQVKTSQQAGVPQQVTQTVSGQQINIPAFPVVNATSPTTGLPLQSAAPKLPSNAVQIQGNTYYTDGKGAWYSDPSLSLDSIIPWQGTQQRQDLLTNLEDIYQKQRKVKPDPALESLNEDPMIEQMFDYVKNTEMGKSMPILEVIDQELAPEDKADVAAVLLDATALTTGMMSGSATMGAGNIASMGLGAMGTGMGHYADDIRLDNIDREIGKLNTLIQSPSFAQRPQAEKDALMQQLETQKSNRYEAFKNKWFNTVIGGTLDVASALPVVGSAADAAKIGTRGARFIRGMAKVGRILQKTAGAYGLTAGTMMALDRMDSGMDAYKDPNDPDKIQYALMMRDIMTVMTALRAGSKAVQGTMYRRKENPTQQIEAEIQPDKRRIKGMEIPYTDKGSKWGENGAPTKEDYIKQETDAQKAYAQSEGMFFDSNQYANSLREQLKNVDTVPRSTTIKPIDAGYSYERRPFMDQSPAEIVRRPEWLASPLTPAPVVRGIGERAYDATTTPIKEGLKKVKDKFNIPSMEKIRKFWGTPISQQKQQSTQQQTPPQQQTQQGGQQTPLPRQQTPPSSQPSATFKTPSGYEINNNTKTVQGLDGKTHNVVEVHEKYVMTEEGGKHHVSYYDKNGNFETKQFADEKQAKDFLTAGYIPNLKHGGKMIRKDTVEYMLSLKKGGKMSNRTKKRNLVKKKPKFQAAPSGLENYLQGTGDLFIPGVTAPMDASTLSGQLTPEQWSYLAQQNPNMWSAIEPNLTQGNVSAQDFLQYAQFTPSTGQNPWKVTYNKPLRPVITGTKKAWQTGVDLGNDTTLNTFEYADTGLTETRGVGTNRGNIYMPTTVRKTGAKPSYGKDIGTTALSYGTKVGNLQDRHLTGAFGFWTSGADDDTVPILDTKGKQMIGPDGQPMFYNRNQFKQGDIDATTGLGRLNWTSPVVGHMKKDGTYDPTAISDAREYLIAQYQSLPEEEQSQTWEVTPNPTPDPVPDPDDPTGTFDYQDPTTQIQRYKPEIGKPADKRRSWMIEDMLGAAAFMRGQEKVPLNEEYARTVYEPLEAVGESDAINRQAKDAYAQIGQQGHQQGGNWHERIAGALTRQDSIGKVQAQTAGAQHAHQRGIVAENKGVWNRNTNRANQNIAQNLQRGDMYQSVRRQEQKDRIGSQAAFLGQMGEIYGIRSMLEGTKYNQELNKKIDGIKTELMANARADILGKHPEWKDSSGNIRPEFQQQYDDLVQAQFSQAWREGGYDQLDYQTKAHTIKKGPYTPGYTVAQESSGGTPFQYSTTAGDVINISGPKTYNMVAPQGHTAGTPYGMGAMTAQRLQVDPRVYDDLRQRFANIDFTNVQSDQFQQLQTALGRTMAGGTPSRKKGGVLEYMQSIIR